MKNSTLPKGYSVKMSETGHRDFYYPSSNVETLLEETTFERMHYVGSNAYVAVKIPTSAVYANATAGQSMIVWVPRGVVYAN